MAIIQNINVASPNDGLGDTLRASQVKANENFTELNVKKVEIVAGFSLSQNNYTDTEKAKLLGIQAGAQVNVRGNMQQQDSSAPDFILGKTATGKILKYGNFTLVGQNLTILAGWIWQINDVVYTNSSNIVINFPFAAVGLQRLDLVVFNALNSAQRVDGDEVASSPLAPLLIPNSILFSISLITDSSVGSPTIPTVSGIQTKRYAGVAQTYTIPTGAVAFKGWINDGVQHLEAVGFEADLNTFTQSGAVVIFKKTIITNNRILIDYYL